MSDQPRDLEIEPRPAGPGWWTLWQWDAPDDGELPAWFDIGWNVPTELLRLLRDRLDAALGEESE